MWTTLAQATTALPQPFVIDTGGPPWWIGTLLTLLTAIGGIVGVIVTATRASASITTQLMAQVDLERNKFLREECMKAYTGLVKATSATVDYLYATAPATQSIGVTGDQLLAACKAVETVGSSAAYAVSREIVEPWLEYVRSFPPAPKKTGAMPERARKLAGAISSASDRLVGLARVEFGAEPLTAEQEKKRLERAAG
jgi:hypothetical protein